MISYLICNNLEIAFVILLADNDNNKDPFAADGKKDSATANGLTSDSENTKDWTISEDKNTSMLEIVAVL